MSRLGVVVAVAAVVVVVSLLPESSAKIVSYPCRKSKVTFWGTRHYMTTCYREEKENGGWSGWSAWKDKGGCSVTCGDGSQTQEHTRACNNPRPSHGGSPCSGSSSGTRTVPCSKPKCAVNGGWSDWSDWKDKGSCSVACGGGTKTEERSRSCDNPKPANGGSDCSGERSESRTAVCGTAKCKVDGRWSRWGEWKDKGECSVTCGGGTRNQERTRSCNNPEPAHGGADCAGRKTQSQTVACSPDDCPEDDGWGAWTSWKDVDECNVLCGGGKQEQERFRTCEKAQCTGDSSQSQKIPCGEEKCGNHCPKSANQTYIHHPTNATRFYQCSNGIAFLHHCGAGLKFTSSNTCAAASDGKDEECRDVKDGTLLEDKSDCHKFYQCSYGRKVQMSCQPGLKFVLEKGWCDWGANC